MRILGHVSAFFIWSFHRNLLLNLKTGQPFYRLPCNLFAFFLYIPQILFYYSLVCHQIQNKLRALIEVLDLQRLARSMYLRHTGRENDRLDSVKGHYVRVASAAALCSHRFAADALAGLEHSL